MTNSLLLHLVFLTATLDLSTQQEQCQRVLTRLSADIPPVVYNGIQPDLTGCTIIGDGSLECPARGVLRDEDIGPLDSVDVSDPDQVRQFYVWHRSNGTVELEFQSNPLGQFDISYINMYTLTNTAAKIGVPSSPSVSAFGATINVVSQQNCAFSSDTNTVMRTTLNLTFRTVTEVHIRFSFTMGTEIEWLFLSEIELCQGTAPSPITCETPPTPTPQPTPPPSPSPTPPPPPTITLSSPPPTGVPVTPDPHFPDSVTLTCSVSSPTDGYQYQWQWWKSGAVLNNDGRFTITTPHGRSALMISGLQYSDAGEYMCTVEYAVCPDEVQCSSATGTFHLNLPVYVQVDTPEEVYIEDTDQVDLVCEVYGYPRDSSLPVWTYETIQIDCGHTITASNTHLLSSTSISTNERVVSLLSIVNVTVCDAGVYTCTITGNSSSVTLTVNPGPQLKETRAEQCTGHAIGVAILTMLLAASITVNLVIFFYYRYLLLRRAHNTGADRNGNEDHLYEQVAERQLGAVVLKENEAYGQCVHSPSHNTRL